MKSVVLRPHDVGAALEGPIADMAELVRRALEDLAPEYPRRRRQARRADDGRRCVAQRARRRTDAPGRHPVQGRAEPDAVRRQRHGDHPRLARRARAAPRALMSVLRLWLIGTVVFIVGALTWGFMPILVPIVMVLGGLGALVAVIVWLARGSSGDDRGRETCGRF